ncbi:C39 family peptidase [Acutalibacter sp. 1XD8-33]|uniref:C39 family peptidase n=1 Tax=Acutalibacter sp. 1XD8-33 TaxID=2320081 RepID=UPI001314980C|nr:C39 family peptidase [Acutalibacter sp. 1XD8-33]
MGSPSPPFYMRHPLLLSSLLSSLVLCSVFASDALEAAFPSPASVPTEECQTFPVSSPLEHSPESIPSPTPAPVPSRFHIQGLPLLYQLPELPTGCEITAMAMVLQYYGIPADKVDLARNYLPQSPMDLRYGENGLLYGPDLDQLFIGDPETEWGCVCGAGALVLAANRYLQDQGSPLHAVDLTGSGPEELYRRVSQGGPVVVLATIVSALNKLIEEKTIERHGKGKSTFHTCA